MWLSFHLSECSILVFLQILCPYLLLSRSSKILWPGENYFKLSKNHKKTISAPFERVKMIMQCIDNEVKTKQETKEKKDDDFEEKGRPSVAVSRVMASIKE